jgi:tetratricopeptide (TPR) repeat protein
MALKRDSRCEQAQYYMGVLLKQSGQPDKAYEHFQRVLKLNPKHLEAAREARLYEMRTRPIGAGLMDKLLGRRSMPAPPPRSSDKPGKPRQKPSWKPTR